MDADDQASNCDPVAIDRNAATALDLAGRTALVTGAGQGVGREIALTFATQNAVVVVNDIDAGRAGSVADEIVSTGGKAIAAPGDVTDFDAMQRLVERVRKVGDPIDVLVNNAGNGGAQLDLAEARPFWETGPDEWRHWLGVNLYGVLNVTRAVWPGMQRTGRGRIITISSDAGRVGEAHLAVYSAAKAGAAGLMRALAKAGGPYGITANVISLGAVDTPGAGAALADPAAVDRMLKRYVIRRLGRPADAAWLALFLASDAAGWITAQTYPVNGGYAVSC